MLKYTTTPATASDLTVEVSATGTLQPLTQVDISSELSGVVRSVSVNENQQVRKGDVLAALDTSRLEAQIERAGASAKAAAANVENARVTLKENEQALLRAGEERSFAVGEVGRIVLGNAGAVEVSRFGDIQDIQPFQRANVARFTVSSDGSLAPLPD